MSDTISVLLTADDQDDFGVCRWQSSIERGDLSGLFGRGRMVCGFCLALLFGLPLHVMAEDANVECRRQAKNLLSRGIELSTKGEAEAARSDLTAALVTFEALGEDRSTADCLLWLATLDAAAGRYEEAIAKHHRALVPLEQLDDAFGLWWTYFSTANLSLHRADDAAIVNFQRALVLLPRLESPASRITTDQVLQLLELESNRDVSSQEVGKLLAAEARVTVRKMAEAVTRCMLAVALMNQDAFEAAEAQFELAIEASRRGGSFFLHHVMLQMAVVQDLLGNGTAVMSYTERALADGSGALPVEMQVMALRLRASQLRRDGKVDEARRALMDALGLATKTELPDSRAEAQMGLANLNLATGAYDDALVNAEQAISNFKLSGNQSGQKRGLMLLNALYGHLGLGNRSISNDSGEMATQLGDDLDVVLAFFGQVEVLRRNGGDPSELLKELQRKLESRDSTLLRDNPGLIASLAGVAGVLNHHDDLDRALAAFKGAKDFPIPGSIDLFKGLLFKKHGKLAEAAQHLVQAYSASLATGRRAQQASAAFALGAVYWQVGMPDDSLKASQIAVDIAASTSTEVSTKDPLVVFLGTKFQDYFSQLVQVRALRKEPEEAFMVAEQAKAETLLRHLAGQRIDLGSSQDSVLTQQVRVQKDRLRALEGALRLASREEVPAREEDLLRQRRLYMDLQVRLRARAPLEDRLVRLESVDLFTVRRQILSNPEVALVSYFVTPEEVLIWVIDADRFEMVRVAIPRDEVAKEVRCFVERLASRGGSIPLAIPRSRGTELLPPAGCSAGLAESTLFDLLVKPILPHLKRERLIIIPHGVLHAVPFAALQNSRKRRYLLEDHIVSYAPSVQSLAYLQWKKSISRGEALVMGNPTSYLPSLPGAEREAKAVAGLLGTAPLLGAAASEKNVRQRIGSVGLMHLASHGVFVPENSFFSRLGLAANESFDGNLEVHEILDELDLGESTMVVLSGCQTALGELTKGDEVVGLSRAFLYAGSPVVVSTLWSVEDESSAHLMEAFYRGLLAGDSVAVALRRAQMGFLAQPELRDPYYWAAFVAQGDARRGWMAPNSLLTPQ